MDLEERYRIVLYVTDSSVTNSWTHVCVTPSSQLGSIFFYPWTYAVDIVGELYYGYRDGR